MLTGFILALAVADAAESKLVLMRSGAMPVMGGYTPQRLQLGVAKPEGLKRAPAMQSPLYGVLEFGAASGKKRFIVATDGANLYVDTNNDGDLTNDPKNAWAARGYSGQNNASYTQHTGSFGLFHPQLNQTLNFGAYVFDPNDSARSALKNVLLYYSDYALTGTVQFPNGKHKVLVADRNATGDFTGTNVWVMVDRDDDGKFDGRYEHYEVKKPFNIEGTTYQLDVSALANNTLSLSKSATSTPEVMAPPNLSVGHTALPFDAEATDGAKIKFPQTYKGKLVMLDFWATWCGPCIAELPNVTKAYEQFHGRGFEILSISLDRENMLEGLTKFTKEHNMPWRQVYDGKYWSARIATMYGIHAIPAVLLVDGDTGEILADASTLRGEAIFKTLETQLSRKFGN